MLLCSYPRRFISWPILS